MGGIRVLVDERVIYRVKKNNNSEYSFAKHLQFNLSRQNIVYDRALAELRAGKKITCWMWYIFPGLRALAKSRKAFVFSLQGPHDERSYLSHPILGKRLIECCKALLTHKDKKIEDILGEVDAEKLHSSMTIFNYVSGDENSVFKRVLSEFFGGVPDYITLSQLRKEIIIWEFTN